MTVTDNVTLDENAEEIILFRWHLATSQEVTIAGEGRRFTIHWPDATITLEGSQALYVAPEKLPDHTLYRDQQSHLHTCLLVHSAQKVNALTLTTQVTGVNAK